MKGLLVSIALVGLIAGLAYGKSDEQWAMPNVPKPVHDSGIAFYDDMESGAPGWTHIDNTALPPKFHVDTYYAYDDGTAPNYSYWCGEFNSGFTGGDGYGNSWDEKLIVPDVDWTGATYPILTCCYRYDSELGFDFTWVEAQKAGAYEQMNPGFNGSSGGWHCYGTYGFVMVDYDLPMKARFHFVSDSWWSDEDGLYDSDGGAFHCDEIEVFDFFGGAQYFYDDVEDGVGLCTPYQSPASGDFWALIELPCRAASDPTCWTVTEPGDTSHVAPNLFDVLYTPIVDISYADHCTLHYALHYCVPGPDLGDGWTVEYSVDGGVTWIIEGAWYGDITPPACNLFSGTGINGICIDEHLPGTAVQMRFAMKTDEGGCGPGASGAAGIFIDDTWFVVEPPPSPVKDATWGGIKALYR